MFEVAALTYGVVASFVLSSASRNARDGVANPRPVALAGWLLLSFSGASATMLLGYAGLHAIG